METKELQIVEFEIKNLVPAKIESNIEELEKFMVAVKEKYHGWVVTEDEIKIATEERTKLNKLEKTISDERKRIQKEANADIEKLIEKLKLAEKDTKSLSNNIAEQIKEFEEKEWENKLKEIEKIKDKIFSENKILEKYFVIGDKWKNKTMSLKKIEEEIKEQFEYWNKIYNFITSQLSAINEEIENKISFEDVQYLMLEDFDNIMKKLVDKKNEIKATEENMKKKAELEAKKEREKQEAVEKATETKTNENKTTENTDKKEAYICIKVSGLSKEAVTELKAVIEKHNLKYVKEMR